MPACSPCGLAVDWSRRCYSSEWHLFADAPHITTAGRYYRPPPGTPFVAVEHHYGSREWHSTNWEKIQSLGEDLTFKHGYDKGQQPESLPDNNIVGSAACISNGEKIANALPYDQFFNGFPRSCMLGRDQLAREWATVATYLSCGLQLFYAKIIFWLYADEDEPIIEAFNLLLPGAIIHIEPGAGNFTRFVIAKYNGFCVVVTDGSRPYQQLAMQGFQGLNPPINMGLYSTLPLWYDNSTRILTKMRDMGIVIEDRVMLAGHSYGSATVCNIVARLKFARPASIVRYIGYGPPKAGDARLALRVDQAQGILLCNFGDLVGSIPPSFENLFALMVLTGIVRLENWDRWRHPHSTVMQGDDGTLTWESPPDIDFPTLAGMLTRILTNQPFDTILTHPTIVYIRRIILRCPACDWPITPALCRFLRREEGELILGSGGDPAQVRLELASGGDPALGGLTFGATGSPSLGGLILGGGGTPDPESLTLGSGGEPGETGMILGSGGEPDDDGLEIGSGGTPDPESLTLGSGGEPGETGMILGSGGEPDDDGLILGEP